MRVIWLTLSLLFGMASTANAVVFWADNDDTAEETANDFCELRDGVLEWTPIAETKYVVYCNTKQSGPIDDVATSKALALLRGYQSQQGIAVNPFSDDQGVQVHDLAQARMVITYYHLSCWYKEMNEDTTLAFIGKIPPEIFDEIRHVYEGYTVLPSEGPARSLTDREMVDQLLTRTTVLAAIRGNDPTPLVERATAEITALGLNCTPH